MELNPQNICLIVMAVAAGVALLALYLIHRMSLDKSVSSLCDATRRPYLNEKGNQVSDDKGNPRYINMDPEDALRLVLEWRMKATLTLLAFAALIAVLVTVIVVSIVKSSDKQPSNYQQSGKNPPATSLQTTGQ